MDNKFNGFLRELIREQGRAIVGRLLNQIDIVSKNTSINEQQKFDILKEFNRELIYGELRNLRNSVMYYSEGREYKNLPIYNPSKDLKKS